MSLEKDTLNFMHKSRFRNKLMFDHSVLRIFGMQHEANKKIFSLSEFVSLGDLSRHAVNFQIQ